MTSRRRSGNGHGRPQRRRLSRSAEFERVYRHGRAKGNRFFVLYAFPRDESERSAHDRSALSAPTAPSTSRANTGDASARPNLSPDAPPAPSGIHANRPPIAPRTTGDGPPDGPRLGLSVSRRVGGAVERSRVKRVLR